MCDHIEPALTVPAAGGLREISNPASQKTTPVAWLIQNAGTWEMRSPAKLTAIPEPRNSGIVEGHLHQTTKSRY